jgi:hypothetical protein
VCVCGGVKVGEKVGGVASHMSRPGRCPNTVDMERLRVIYPEHRLSIVERSSTSAGGYVQRCDTFSPAISAQSFDDSISYLRQDIVVMYATCWKLTGLDQRVYLHVVGMRL